MDAVDPTWDIFGPSGEGGQEDISSKKRIKKLLKKRQWRRTRCQRFVADVAGHFWPFLCFSVQWECVTLFHT